MRYLLACFLVIVGPAGAAVAAVARGVVFEDVDGDKVRDEGEPGVAGVLVSNGGAVVATDGEGRYQVALEVGQTLFITKPSGYVTAVDHNQLPQFYYHHQPQGTPELGLRYRGLDPSGELPPAIDFPLRRRPEEPRFTAVWFADPQPQTAAELDYIRDDVIAELIGIDAVFGITLGDIMYDDLSLLPRSNRLLASIGIPWYNVPGNHELNYLAPDSTNAFDTFKRHFGPCYYSFDVAQVHFVVLSDVAYAGRDQGLEEDQELDPLGRGAYSGALDERQLAWLGNDLGHVPADRLVVLAMHIPLRSHLDPELPFISLLDHDELFRLLENRGHLLAVAGHTHIAEHHYFGAQDGFAGSKELHQHVLGAVCGSWWSGPRDERGIPTSWMRDGSPRGYYLMEVDGTQVSLRFKAAGRAEDFQMRIMLDTGFPRDQPETRRDFRHGELVDTRINIDQVYSTEVLVNLFDGGPRSSVEVAFDGGSPHQMQASSRNDPFFEELVQRHGDSVKRGVKPVQCSHLWAARLPRDMDPGIHTLRVRAIDEYSREHVQHRVIEVIGQYW